LAVVERFVSQPFVSGAAVLQSAQPDAHPPYVQPVPLHAAPRLWVELVSHACPHAPQLAVVARFVSQPSVSGGAVLQSAHPDAQPVYVHAVPPQLAPRLCVESHDCPQAPQFDAVVETCVSQPSVSGGAVLQSAHPDAQPVYVHVVPLQPAPRLWPEPVSHALPHPPQLVVVERLVSQPLVSGALLSQSAHPDAQPVYVHAVPLQPAPRLWPEPVSHAFPHALQFDVDDRNVSHPFVSGAVLLQSAHPDAHPV